MMPLIAWIGAITGFLGGFGMLFLPAPPETRSRMRRQGIISLCAGTMCVVLLATRLI
jgi:membrane associated rhomboid family serine protease